MLIFSLSYPSAAYALPRPLNSGFILPNLSPLIATAHAKGSSISSSSISSASISDLNFPVPSHTKSHNKQSIPKFSSDLNIPKNLIVPKACTQNCTKIIGTEKDDIIIATAVTDAIIYALAGNDVIQCGPGICKVFGGPGNNIMISGSSSSAQLYGGSGNNIFIGGTGDTLMVGGKGNDQFYAGSSHDVMIGGGGANYFDCGPNGNGVVLDFNAKNGDTKASNCKFVITVPTSARTPP
jgi:hypothetical protein